MPTWRPIILTLFPTPNGHEGALTIHMPGGTLILEVRHWHKGSGHIEAEVRLEIGDETGAMDAEFEALADGLAGAVRG